MSARVYDISAFRYARGIGDSTTRAKWYAANYRITKRCRACGEPGHTRRTCTNEAAVQRLRAKETAAARAELERLRAERAAMLKRESEADDA